MIEPGKRVRGSRTGRPIMVLLDLLGQRWTLRVLWELRDGPVSFRALRAKCDDVSPTLLNARLKQLREGGIVELGDEGFRLSSQGAALAGHLNGLNRWAKGWAQGNSQPGD
ncbi:winged helix-turn-helix transcriptional regulator [Erythrobacter mangrovi]|uniref:Helix-turn-helix transcriptional regulator n=1 Tax=Erythrobacter mangrovi TaxID=2739433 RepID=A0A7D3XGN0_9SPHN|nr:helix-turn-helix domain-containing protein [Erythrobacter mangrovi]QKG70418.1 helix-turn-helix transcriptional regulator [Erythrobacter mangrovi]